MSSREKCRFCGKTIALYGPDLDSPGIFCADGCQEEEDRERASNVIAQLEADLAAARGALKSAAELFVCCIDGGINEHSEECPYFDITPPAQEPHPEPCETCDATGSGIVPAQETEPPKGCEHSYSARQWLGTFQQATRMICTKCGEPKP